MAVVMVVFCVTIVANSMSKDVARDEQMYCTAGALLAQGKMIYRDFSYPSQLPYHPLLLAALYRLSGTTHYLLAGRLTSVLCDILTVIAILGIYRAIFGACRLQGMLFGMAGVTLYLFSPLVDYALGHAWNHDVVIFCVVLSLWLFVTTDFRARSRFWRMAVLGVLLTVATFMRVTTVLVELLFLAALLWVTGGTIKNRIATALPFVSAALAAMVWPVWIIAQAPEAFRLNLIRIPALYGQWLHEVQMTFDKLSLTLASLATPGYLILLALIGYLLASVLRHSSSLDAQEKRKAIFTALLPPAFFGIAYIPPTIWQQYLAVPVPFIVVGLAYPLASLLRGAQKPEGSGRYRLAVWLVGIGAVVAVLAYPIVLYRSLIILVPENWVPLQLHKTAQEIAAKVPQPRLVLTLGPLYAIEGGCDIYPELSCGSIVYRIADQMALEDRQITHTVGSKTLADLITSQPPAAVLVGIEPPYFSTLEDPLRKSAPPNWRREVYNDRLQLYVRP
ncbi:MAG: hypothetical protein JW955_08000 [Sedimentisphaerales bacterium]|nr:hypothetical protein [Sedimentisphaerales bacterium]